MGTIRFQLDDHSPIAPNVSFDRSTCLRTHRRRPARAVRAFHIQNHPLEHQGAVSHCLHSVEHRIDMYGRCCCADSRPRYTMPSYSDVTPYTSTVYSVKCTRICYHYNKVRCPQCALRLRLELNHGTFIRTSQSCSARTHTHTHTFAHTHTHTIARASEVTLVDNTAFDVDDITTSFVVCPWQITEKGTLTAKHTPIERRPIRISMGGVRQ